MPFRDEHGFLRYDDATTMLRDLSGEQSGLHAIIPSKHNRLADEAGAPMETISENPAFLSDPLALSSQAQSATMMETLEGKLNAEPQKTTKLNEEKFREHEAIWEAELQKTTKLIEEMFREHKTWWKAELQELKELDVSAENRYQRLLNEEREERIKGDAANEAHTAAVEQLVIQKVSLLTFDTCSYPPSQQNPSSSCAREYRGIAHTLWDRCEYLRYNGGALGRNIAFRKARWIRRGGSSTSTQRGR